MKGFELDSVSTEELQRSSPIRYGERNENSTSLSGEGSMHKRHCSTTNQRVHMVSELIANEGKYGLISSMSSHHEVSRETLYTWKGKRSPSRGLHSKGGVEGGGETRARCLDPLHRNPCQLSGDPGMFGAFARTRMWPWVRSPVLYRKQESERRHG